MDCFFHCVFDKKKRQHKSKEWVKVKQACDYAGQGGEEETFVRDTLSLSYAKKSLQGNIT